LIGTGHAETQTINETTGVEQIGFD